MEAHAGTITGAQRVAPAEHPRVTGVNRKPRRRSIQMIRERARARRRERAIRAHGVRAGSPPGAADRMYFLPPKAY